MRFGFNNHWKRGESAPMGNRKRRTARALQNLAAFCVTRGCSRRAEDSVALPR
jgi:hypothetical protein